MLLAHFVPDNIVVGKGSPSSGDLSCLAERGSIEEGKDSEGEFGREGGDEVDSDEVSESAGDERELREAALGKDPLEDEDSLAGRCSGEDCPDVRDGLLVRHRQLFQALLDLLHGRLIRLPTTFEVGVVSVTVLCVCRSLWRMLAGVLVRDVFGEEGDDGDFGGFDVHVRYYQVGKKQ